MPMATCTKVGCPVTHKLNLSHIITNQFSMAPMASKDFLFSFVPLKAASVKKVNDEKWPFLGQKFDNFRLFTAFSCGSPAGYFRLTNCFQYQILKTPNVGMNVESLIRNSNAWASSPTTCAESSGDLINSGALLLSLPPGPDPPRGLFF